MRIFSKKSFQFDHPAGQEEPVIVQALAFADVPEWVVDSAMYKLASAEGSVEVTDGKAQEADAENKANDLVLNQLKARAKELKIAGYTKMDAAQLLASIEEAAKANANTPQNPPADPTTNPNGDNTNANAGA